MLTPREERFEQYEQDWRDRMEARMIRDDREYDARISAMSDEEYNAAFNEPTLAERLLAKGKEVETDPMEGYPDGEAERW